MFEYWSLFYQKKTKPGIRKKKFDNLGSVMAFIKHKREDAAPLKFLYIVSPSGQKLSTDGEEIH